MPVIGIRSGDRGKSVSQCQKPRGWVGRVVLRWMNRRHSRLTDWGLGHVAVGEHDAVLDVGCGGGRTLAKLAAMARDGTIHGIDYAAESVAAARRFNRGRIGQGRIGIERADVSNLPFAHDTFDLVTAVETHFWWQDLDAGIREIRRVLKPGAHMTIIAEFYNGGRHARYAERMSRLTGMAVLDVAQHSALLSDAGFTNVQIFEERERGWLCCVGTKPR